MAKKVRKKRAPTKKAPAAPKKTQRRKGRRKGPNLENALKVTDFRPYFSQLSEVQNGELLYKLCTHLHWSLGDPTLESLQQLRAAVPSLDRVIDFDTVFRRLEYLRDFEGGPFGVSLSQFFPELKTVYQASVEFISRSPAGISKAIAFLRPIAQDAGADADLEAAVYLASRGESDAIDSAQIADSWHAAICSDIGRGRPVGRVPKAVLKRAEARTISLAEAAEVLRFHGSLPRFFGFRDEEEDHIDQTMFRAVEWFAIAGFEPWLCSLLSDLSVGPQSGIEHAHAAWWLFHWCRSDLALSMADRQGLESWLWTLLNGPHERSRPWRLSWSTNDFPGLRDYLPIAGILPFAWHRIRPTQMKDDVVREAIDLLLQTQTRAGGWPLLANDVEPCLMATYAALHGLALAKPNGWMQVAQRGAAWLLEQQHPLGYWTISGGPTILLTVLVLDALELAGGGNRVTFELDATGSSITSTVESDEREVEYDYDQQPWHDPQPPATLSERLATVRKAFQPQVGLVVATETELRQVLRVLKPIPPRKKIWKVVQGPDTFFAGRFGAFTAVVMLTGMGSEGPAGATLSVDSIIRVFNPSVIVMVGIAFGAHRRKQQPADVLVAEQLIPYEHQRVGAQLVYRSAVPPSSAALLNRFRHALDWTFLRPDGSPCTMHLGPVLSGGKLVDDVHFKSQLLTQFSNAIGGEMEGSGLWSAAERAHKQWILVKAVCDWADGQKHGKFQEMAAASAVSLCEHVFNDPRALDGLNGSSPSGPE